MPPGLGFCTKGMFFALNEFYSLKCLRGTCSRETMGLKKALSEL